MHAQVSTMMLTPVFNHLKVSLQLNPTRTTRKQYDAGGQRWRRSERSRLTPCRELPGFDSNNADAYSD